MNIKAIALDMDGTLLQSNHQPSERTKEFLVEMENKGVEVIVATGRSHPAAAHIVKELGLQNETIICFNGAKIVNLKDDSVIYEKNLEASSIKTLMRLAKEHQIHINLYQGDTWYVDDIDSEETKFYSNKCGIQAVYRAHDDFDHYDMPKVVFIGEHDKLLKLKEDVLKELGDVVNTSFSSDIFFEVMDKTVNKGKTLKWYLDSLKIGIDECAAFGDAENDLEMLQTVKYGVAMGNAEEDFKAKLNYETLSNDEDGIVAFFQK